MIDVKQLRDYVVVPTLGSLGANSPAAVELVLGTGIQESRLTYLHQLGGGPAVGLFQMEPATHDDIWENYLAFRADLGKKVTFTTIIPPGSGLQPAAAQMAGNLYYAAAMCRIHYMRVSDPLPQPGDLKGMAEYWKEHYNTFEGAGTVEEYMEHVGESLFGL
jgi:hypothetical protein